MAKYHLAQVNTAKARDEMDTATMAGFKNRLDEINALAETADGFVWRLQDEAGDATSIRVFEDPLLLVNISVWRDVRALQEFVYRSVHVDLIRDRENWFHKMPIMHQALWWVPADHIPTPDEAKEKLKLLEQNGPSSTVFTFGKSFPAPDQG
jgi:hypothetical protein